MQFHLMAVSMFVENVCERSWSQPIARKEDLISMYRGTVVGSIVNIPVYFNKLANNS